MTKEELDKANATAQQSIKEWNVSLKNSPIGKAIRAAQDSPLLNVARDAQETNDKFKIQIQEAHNNWHGC